MCDGLSNRRPRNNKHRTLQVHLYHQHKRMDANVIHLRRRIHRSPRHVRRVFQAHQRGLRVVINLRPDDRLDLLPRQNPVLAQGHSRHAAGNRRHRSQLIQIHVASLFANHFVAVMRPHFDANEIPHAPRRHKQRRLFPKNLCRALLQAVDRRVFPVNVIPDLRLRHRPPHLRRRPRHRIAPQVHHSRRNLPRLRNLIRIHPLIPLRHCVAHLFLFSVNGACPDRVGVPSVSSVLKASLNFNPIRPVPNLTSSIPQTPHSKHSISLTQAAPSYPPAPPNPPTPADQIAPSASPRNPARFAQYQFHRAAAIQETALPPARSPPSAFHAAPRAIARPAPQSRKPPHRARSPTAPSPKTNAPPLQIPGTPHAANISGCAAIRTLASPNSKSRSGDNPPPARPPAPSHKTPPSH